MNPPNTIASDTLVEAIARAIIDGLADFSGEPRPTDGEWDGENMSETREMLADLAQAALTAITEAGYAIVPREPTEAMARVGVETESGLGPYTLPTVVAASYRAMISIAAQAIEARSGETEGLDPQGESAVGATDAPDFIMPPPIRDSGPLESEEGE